MHAKEILEVRWSVKVSEIQKNGIWPVLLAMDKVVQESKNKECTLEYHSIWIGSMKWSKSRLNFLKGHGDYVLVFSVSGVKLVSQKVNIVIILWIV